MVIAQTPADGLPTGHYRPTTPRTTMNAASCRKAEQRPVTVSTVDQPNTSIAGLRRSLASPFPQTSAQYAPSPAPTRMTIVKGSLGSTIRDGLLVAGILETILQPESFLEICVHDVNSTLGLTGASVGYEQKLWRCNQFADHILEWLPEFALSPTEVLSIKSSNAVALIRKAARSIYATEKYRRRGEFGELLLHILMRQVFDTIPAISKIYYKDSANDTIKGFDAVHVLDTGSELELWLGEAKFYQSIRQAIRDVVKELHEHLDADYLRHEFALIGNKVEGTWPLSEALKELMHRNRTLDEVFARLCFPVLLTYDSPVVRKHDVSSDAYLSDLKNEFKKHYHAFNQAGLPCSVRIHLFLLPLREKAELVRALDERLKSWQ